MEAILLGITFHWLAISDHIHLLALFSPLFTFPNFYNCIVYHTFMRKNSKKSLQILLWRIHFLITILTSLVGLMVQCAIEGVDRLINSLFHNNINNLFGTNHLHDFLAVNVRFDFRQPEQFQPTYSRDRSLARPKVWHGLFLWFGRRFRFRLQPIYSSQVGQAT